MQHELVADKIKENLNAQKDRLNDYLTVLDCESKDIAAKDSDKLQSHVKMESDIVSELSLFKKTLQPLEDMYEQSPFKKDDSLDDLRASVMSITAKIKEKSDENKKMLNKTLTEMENQKLSLPKRNLSKDSYNDVDSRFVDIVL